MKKSNGTTGTLYWYMTPGIVAESDLNGNLQSEYVFFDSERVARRRSPGQAVTYYFSDHLKTTDIVTDAQGNIKRIRLLPWGGELQFLASDSNHYKFTGKERDAESGLDYFGARVLFVRFGSRKNTLRVRLVLQRPRQQVRRPPGMRVRYLSLGGELQFTNSNDNHYRFTGKERDSESGLD